MKRKKRVPVESHDAAQAFVRAAPIRSSRPNTSARKVAIDTTSLSGERWGIQSTFQTLSIQTLGWVNPASRARLANSSAGKQSHHRNPKPRTAVDITVAS